MMLHRLFVRDLDTPDREPTKLWASAISLVWLACAVRISIGRPTITLSDMFRFIPRAEQLSLEDASSWANGLYPFGYVLLLKLVFACTGDYQLAGRILSLVFGALGLYLVHRICTLAFGASVGLLALALCGASRTYLLFTTTSGTDMAAAVLLLACVLFLCQYARKNDLTFLIAAGVATGASYLMRYTALTVCPAIILWLIVRPNAVRDWPSRIRQILAFTLGFLAVSSPQLVASQLVHGNPLYNLQAQNVYFGMFGDENWGLNMNEAKSVTSLTQIIVEHPSEFVHNWLANLARSLIKFVRVYSVHAVALPGMLYALLNPRSRSLGLLFTLLFGTYTAAISIAFVTPRLLLFSGMILTLLAAVGLIALVPRRIRVSDRRVIPVHRFLLPALAILPAYRYVLPNVLDPLDEYYRGVIRVSSILEDEGLQHSSHVLSLSFDYYDMSDPTKERFAIPWYKPDSPDFSPYESVDDIASRMKEAGQRFFVFDRRAPRNVPGLTDIWPLDPQALKGSFRHVASLPTAVHVYALREASK